MSDDTTTKDTAVKDEVQVDITAILNAVRYTSMNLVDNAQGKRVSRAEIVRYLVVRRSERALKEMGK